MVPKQGDVELSAPETFHVDLKSTGEEQEANRASSSVSGKYLVPRMSCTVDRS